MAQYPGFNMVSTHYRYNYECKKLYGSGPGFQQGLDLTGLEPYLTRGKSITSTNTLACYKNNYDCKTLYDSGLGLQKGLDTL